MSRDQLLQSAAYRALRTFVQTFVGAILSLWMAGDRHGLTDLWHTLERQWDVSGGAALIAAVLAAGWRLGLDPSRFPSAKDPAPDNADAGRH